MVGVFVGLKLALLRGSLRRSRVRAAGFVVGTSVGVAGSFWAAVNLAAARPAAEAADLAVLTFTGLAIAWLALPLSLGAGADESADPTRLVVLPVRPRALITGATAAALIGPAPLCTLILVAGAATGAARGAGGGGTAVAGAAAAAVVTVLLCVVGSRAVTAAFARALTGRRGKDAAALGGVLTAVGGYGAYLLLGTAGSGPELPPSVVRGLRWAPPGWAADTVRAAADGRGAVVAAELAAATTLTVLLMLWWHRSLTRLMTTADASTAQAVTERGGGSGTTARLLSASRTLLVAHHQLTAFLRAPRHRMTLIAALAYALLFPVVIVPVGAKSPYVAIGGAWVFGLTAPGVLFALDGSAIWTNVATLRTRAHARAELLGRMLPQMALIVPWMTAVALVTALITGRTDQLAAAVGLTFALLGVTFAIGMVISVHWPYPYPENPFEVSAPGQNGGYHSANLVGTLIGLLAVSPLVIGAFVLEGSPRLWLLLPLGTVYGVLAVALTLRVMARRLHDRAPEVLTALRAS